MPEQRKGTMLKMKTSTETTAVMRDGELMIYAGKGAEWARAELERRRRARINPASKRLNQRNERDGI
jgi:hypothetical protein